MAVPATMMPVSTGHHPHHIVHSAINRLSSGEHIVMNHPNSAVQPLSALNDRPRSTISVPTMMPYMPATPMEHYYVWTQPPSSYQPQMTISGPVGASTSLMNLALSSLDSASSALSEHEKMKQRLARKAELARMSRKRKKATLGEMHDKFESLQRENEQLKADLAKALVATKSKCSCSEHEGDAPDMGLLIKRDHTPALSEFSPVSSPVSVASSLSRIPSALDLAKVGSEGAAPFTAARDSSIVGLSFNSKVSAFSVVKSNSFSPSKLPLGSRSHLPFSSTTSEEDSDCQVMDSKRKKQRS